MVTVDDVARRLEAVPGRWSAELRSKPVAIARLWLWGLR